MGGRTSPPATSGPHLALVTWWRGREWGGAGVGAGCARGKGSGVTGARAHPERGDSGDKGPSPSSVFGDLRDPPRGVPRLPPQPPRQPRGSWGFVPAPEAAHPSCPGAPGCHRGSCSLGTLFPCHPPGGYCPPLPRGSLHKGSVPGTGTGLRVLGGLQEPNSPAVGRNRSLRGPLDGHANTPRSLPSPRGLMHTREMPETSSRQTQPPTRCWRGPTGIRNSPQREQKPG